MTDAELYNLLTESIDAILATVSIYFTIVSAYIGALYFFLRRAPALLKLAAFTLLSGGLLFLGLTMIGVERMTSGAFYALLDRPLVSPEAQARSIYFGMEQMMVEHYEVAVWAGWLVAFALYASMFYLTFVHRWPDDR